MKQINAIGKPLIILLLTLVVSSCSLISKNTEQIPAAHDPASFPGTQNRSRNQIVQSSYQTLGSPYRYGGTTTNGFDCSGLTRHVYQSAGIHIPRTAAQQRDQSRRISSYSKLLPGDLIFFKTGKRTNHVGIYVGNGDFIHASTGKKKVIKVKLDSPYWRRTFVKFGTYVR